MKFKKGDVLTTSNSNEKPLARVKKVTRDGTVHCVNLLACTMMTITPKRHTVKLIDKQFNDLADIVTERVFARILERLSGGNGAGSFGGERMTTEQAGDYFGLSVGMLQNWRYEGKNDVPFLKLGGGRVYYTKTDLDAWLESRKMTQTPAKQRRRAM